MTNLLPVASTICGAAVLAYAQMTGKQAADEMDALKSCLYRFGASIPFCWLLMRATEGRWTFAVTTQQAVATSGIAIIAWGLGALLLFHTMKLDGMNRASSISNSLSVWVAILSIIFLGESFFPALVLVLLLVLAGIYFMSPDKKAGAASWRWGIPAALAVALIWATSIVLTRVYIRGIAPAEFVLIKVITVTVFHFATSRGSRAATTPRGIRLSIISAATLVCGDTLFMIGLKGLPASIAAPLYTTTIPFAFLLSIFILHEKATWKNWTGMALIFAAAAISGYFGAI